MGNSQKYGYRQKLLEADVSKNTPNPASGTHSASPEIAGSNDGHSVLALSCSASSLRMTRGLLMMASHRRNGGTEIPPPPRRYALSKPGYLPSSICHTPRGLHQGGRDYGGSRMAGSAYCQRAIDTVGAGVRSQLGEDAVAS
jgi:hypothetical protein